MVITRRGRNVYFGLLDGRRRRMPLWIVESRSKAIVRSLIWWWIRATAVVVVVVVTAAAIVVVLLMIVHVDVVAVVRCARFRGWCRHLIGKFDGEGRTGSKTRWNHNGIGLSRR